jgi:hypothetical protein
MPISTAILSAIWLSVAGYSLALAPSDHSARHSSPATAFIVVDTGLQYQEVDSFGCSEAFQRAVFGREGLSPKNTDYVLDLLYSVERELASQSSEMGSAPATPLRAIS